MINDLYKQYKAAGGPLDWFGFTRLCAVSFSGGTAHVQWDPRLTSKYGLKKPVHKELQQFYDESIAAQSNEFEEAV